MTDNKNFLIGIFLLSIIWIFFNPFEIENADKKETERTIQDQKIDDKHYSNLNINLVEKDSSLEETQEEKEFVLENNSIRVTFSNLNAQIKSVVLKDYYSYQEYNKSLGNESYEKIPIEIFNSNESEISIHNSRNEKITNGYFDCEINEMAGQIILTRNINKDKSIQYIYSLNNKDNNIINLQIISNRISDPELSWSITVPNTEKSKTNQEQYTGFYFQEDYSKDVDYIWDNKKFKNIDVSLKWIAFKQQFFSTILTAQTSFDRGSRFRVEVKENEEYIKKLTLKAPLSNGNNIYEIYCGPNSYNKLKTYNKSYEEIVPLGWGIFGWVNKYIVIPIFNFLTDTVNIKNFGIIILILTLIIKLALSPFTYKSYLGQAKMKVLKPEIDKINEKHKGKDPMKVQQETMSLYRKAGVNPLGGCLPLLFQFPILIAMFRFFPASIELRQKSFLWADDLSSYDSIYNLGFHIPAYGDHISLFTLLMTISTLIYTRMNSQMTSSQMPGMKMMMYMMPIMFLGFFNSYASALSYYYFLANVFTFSQMYLMRKFVDEKSILAQIEKNKKIPRKKSKWQKKLEDIQKKQAEQMKKRRK